MTKVDYGLDAPGVVRGFAIAGAVLAVVTVALVAAGLPVAPELFGLCAVMFLATVAAMLHSSRRGKLLERDRLLDGLALRGDEEVLDVGCGRGLLLLGAARRLPRGRAVGIDLWSATDQSDNHRAATLANAEAEGVGDRVEVLDADMRALPFADARFDAVVSSIAIHNLEDAADRERACLEIARVLRPGGRVAVIDFRATEQYAHAFEDAGLVDIARLLAATYRRCGSSRRAGPRSDRGGGAWRSARPYRRGVSASRRRGEEEGTRRGGGLLGELCPRSEQYPPRACARRKCPLTGQKPSSTTAPASRYVP